MLPDGDRVAVMDERKGGAAQQFGSNGDALILDELTI